MVGMPFDLPIVHGTSTYIWEKVTRLHLVLGLYTNLWL